MLRRALLVVVLSNVAAAASAAGTVRFSSPAGGQVLTAGRLVDVAWGELPPDVREFELLLRVGDDPRATVRLTRSLADGESAYRWRVPNLPLRGARLVIRGEVDEREVELGSSESFEVAADPVAPLQEISLRDGELWAAPETAPPPLDALTGGSSERLAESRSDDPAAEAPRGAAAALQAFRTETTIPGAFDGDITPPSRFGLSSLPRFVPRRN